VRLWTQRYVLTALCSFATLFGGGLAQAEGDAKVTQSRVPTARVDFHVTVPHFLDIRLSPSTGGAERGSAVLEQVRIAGSPTLRSAVAEATALRVDGVRIASNRGQVMLSIRSDDYPEFDSQLRGVSSEESRLGPHNVLRAVAFVTDGRPGLRKAGVLPAPNRAGVTQAKTAWLRAYSREAGFVPAVARSQAGEAIVPTATYIAVVP
jgi:hypothetical protein